MAAPVSRGTAHLLGGVAVLLLSVALPSLAMAGDPAAGQRKAKVCTTCHGAQGISQMPNAPNLAGQPEIYLVEQLEAFRSGTRSNEVMAVIAKPLSDQDISDLAAWFSSIEIEVKGAQ